MKNRFTIAFLFVAFSFIAADAMESVGLGVGGETAISKDNTYNDTFYISPHFKLDQYFVAYGYHPNITSDTSLHTMDVGLMHEFGQTNFRPYVIGGVGYAVYNHPSAFLSGIHAFGTFGLNLVLFEYNLAMGPMVKYNFVGYASQEKIVADQDFSIHQFLTFAFGIDYTF